MKYRKKELPILHDVNIDEETRVVTAVSDIGCKVVMMESHLLEMYDLLEEEED